ncbi:homeobox protein cut-like 2 [Hoplias malabaricus]|uniref:homeobox protein cut-like 2 n=1 Tax=Hoplias malabaricus TaxID=27720 RepID=UPI00346305F0
MRSNEPRIQTRIKDQRRHNASGLDTGSEEIVKAILEKVRHEMQHQQDTGEHDRGSAGDNLISSAIQVKQEAEESGILDQRPLDHDLLSAASHTDFVQNIIQKVKSEIGAGDTFSNCTNSEIHPLTSSSSSTSGTTHSPSLSWKQDKMQSPPSREEMEFIGMRFGTEEDHADKIMIPDHLTFESYKENFQPPEGQGGQNYAGSLLVNNGLDTLSITRRVKEVLVENNLGQRLFGEQVLGLTQGSVSDLLSQPKPWSELSLKGREPFLRMYFWLKDPQNVERLVAMKRTGHRARSKRPFTFLSSGSESSSPEAFLDSITDHSGHCSMAKRSRVVLSSQEKDVLHRVFQQEPYPSQQTTQRLASQLGLQHSTVINWFYNHRSRLRRIIQEGRSVTTNYTSSPLPYTEPMSHFSDHHSYRGLDTSLLTVKQEPSEVELSEVRRETDIYLDTMYVSTAVQSSRNLKLEDEEEDINRRNLSREDGIQTATVMNDDPDGPRKLSANQKASLT